MRYPPPRRALRVPENARSRLDPACQRLLRNRPRMRERLRPVQSRLHSDYGKNGLNATVDSGSDLRRIGGVHLGRYRKEPRCGGLAFEIVIVRQTMPNARSGQSVVAALDVKHTIVTQSPTGTPVPAFKRLDAV